MILGESAPAALDLDDLLAPVGQNLGDLPAPRASSGGFADLPAPRAAGGIGDLPAPKTAGGLGDLPAPRAGGGGFADLPAPRAAGGFGDLPAPKSSGGAPGFFDDLPMPQQGGGITPAAKGRAMSDLPAPKAGGADLFADIPMPKPASRAPAAGPPSMIDLDDLALGPSTSGVASAPAPLPPMPGRAVPPPRPQGHSQSPVLDLDDEIGLPPPATPVADPNYGGLDLPPPTATGGAAGINFKGSEKIGDGPKKPVGPGLGAAADLDLATDDDAARSRPNRATAAKNYDPAKTEAAQLAEAQAESRARKKKISAIAGAALVIFGGGGFFAYRHYAAKKALAAAIESHLHQAAAALDAGTPKHWNVAIAQAHQAAQLSPNNPHALAIEAEADLAAAWDEGTQQKQRIAAASALLTQLGAARGDEIEKAQSLKLLVIGHAAMAVTRLAAITARDPGDGNAQLFLGWAKYDARDFAGAIAAFDASIKALPKRDLPALYGRARAKLQLGDLDGARKDFGTVLERDKNSIGAQVGLADVAPLNAGAQRESDMMALLQRKDIDAADPRIVAHAWTIAGDEALRAGRLDAASDRYHKATIAFDGDLQTAVGLATLNFAQEKFDAASDQINAALTIAPDDIEANLLRIQVDLHKPDLAAAAARLTSLRERKPAIANPAYLGRLDVLYGNWLETQAGKESDAIAAYDAARKVLGDGDLSPTVAAANLIGRMADKATASGDTEGATKLRDQADALLAPLAERGKTDPNVAVTLGVAYLASGNPVKAENELNVAIAARPNDIEAHFQLAEALKRQNRLDDSLAMLHTTFELDPKRVDVGLVLARNYEDNGRDKDATAMYDKLLSGADISLDLRARAGRFYARTKQIDKARAQSEPLLKADPDSAAGLFLKATGLMADNKIDEARRNFQLAADKDSDAQYWDALGGADEALMAATHDGKYSDEAVRAYMQASQLSPTMFNPRLRGGLLHLARHEDPKAVEALTSALQLQPNNADVLYGLGVAEQEQTHLADATNWLTKSVAIKPNADAYNRLGKLYYDQEKVDAAAGAFARATELGLAQEHATGEILPWLTESLYLLGRIEPVRRDEAAARHAWELYLGRNPSDHTQSDEVRREMRGLRGH